MSLRDRAAGTDVATTGGERQEPTVHQLLERMKPEMAKALPEHISADRLARIALTTVNQNRALLEANSTTLLGALMTCAQLGLEPGPLGEAYLVPFKGKVQFIAGYKGLMKLAYQSGLVASIDAHVVLPGEQFEYEFGLTPRLVHVPGLRRDPKAPTVAVWAAAKFTNGGSAFVVLGPDDLDEARRDSASSSRADSPWQTRPRTMERKTAIRRLSTFLPTSAESRMLQHAVRLDNSVRLDVAAPLDDSRPQYVQVEQGPRSDPRQGSEGDQYAPGEPDADEISAALRDQDVPPPRDPWSQ